ncbi:carbohydrate ABC transporter permease [Alloiococcus sp. CFN-8]|uniref:carbohydrate ABC transporter permease n=1 Tax=Alloiococcus sp. CFN-8 TaxID=3416081 RepID=UPI003CF54BF5
MKIQRNNILRKKDASPKSGVGEALIKGSKITRASLLIWGLGNLFHKQIVKGFIFLALEISCLSYIILFGINSLINFTTLGTNVQQEVFNESKQIYEYVAGDNSMLMLLYGVITIFIFIVTIILAVSSVKSAYSVQKQVEKGNTPLSFKQELKMLIDERLHVTLLFLPITGIVVFTIIPLVYMILIAFTNYDSKHQPPGNLFDWVGFKNFVSMLSFGGKISSTFWTTLTWTVIWAFAATVSCYVLGMILAIIINRKKTRAKGFWRFIFILSVAMPQFVSLLTMRVIFNANGPMNVLLRTVGVLEATESIPFFTNAGIAKVMIIIINIWIGVPFTMLTTTGILQNIPSELYESARIDGAGNIAIFFKITLPYMLFITAPYLITQFVGNINNFNVIYLLTGGGPESLDLYNAGKTDLLVTWLYKLTIEKKDYNLGSVIGIIIFVIMATSSLLVYRRTGAYKNEEGFQ